MTNEDLIQTAEALSLAEVALTQAAMILDSVKFDAICEGRWTDEHQQTRDKIAKALQAVIIAPMPEREAA